MVMSSAFALNNDTPTVALIHQVVGAVAQFDRVALVAKFKGARDRKRRETGKCEGRKSHAELRPEAVALAKHLREANSKAGERQSLRAIGLALAEAGFLNERGRVFNPQSIKAMLG
jgi:hypothetical protein